MAYSPVMAVTWTFSDWITLADAASQRARLVLHVQEVTDRVAEFMEQDLGELSGKRFPVEKYLEGLMKELRKFDTALGLGIESAKTYFTRGKATRIGAGGRDAAGL